MVRQAAKAKREAAAAFNTVAAFSARYLSERGQRRRLPAARSILQAAEEEELIDRAPPKVRGAGSARVKRLAKPADERCDSDGPTPAESHR